MGRIGCVLLCVAIFLIGKGGQGVYTGLSNINQTEMTLADYVNQRPSSTWLKLKDCRVSTIEAAYISSWGAIKEVFIPLRVPGADSTAKVHVLLATKDRAVINLMYSMKETKTEKDALAFAIQKKDQLLQTRDVSGVIRFGLDMKDSDRRKLAGLDKNLTSDFVIISEGESPSILLSIVMLVGGVLLLGVMLLAMLSGGSSEKKSTTTETI